MLTSNQIKWAAQHDWFIKDNGDGTITVLECCSNEDGIYWDEPIVFSSFSELYAWAGY